MLPDEFVDKLFDNKTNDNFADVVEDIEESENILDRTIGARQRDGWSIADVLTTINDTVKAVKTIKNIAKSGSRARARARRKSRLSKLRSMTVKQPQLIVRDDTISVLFIYPHAFYRDIKRYYRTSKVLHMFVDKTSVKVPTYFALDLYRTFVWLQTAPYVTPMAKMRYKLAADLMLKETWVGDEANEEETDATPLLNLKKLKNLNITLFKHQEPLLHFYNKTVPRLHLRGVIVSSAVGSGKTILSLAMAETNESDFTIIICPLPTVDRVWTTTIEQIFKKKQKYWKSKSKTPIDMKARFHIVHFESLKNYTHDILKVKSKLAGKKITVILDEAHDLNELTSIRTQQYIKLVDELNPSMVLPMSGTSVKAVSTELLPSFRAIDPKFTEEVAVKFKKMYAGNNTGVVALLRERVKDLTYLVEKNEIGVEPPEKVNVMVKIPNGEEYTLEVIKTKLTAYIKERKKFYAMTADQDRKVLMEILQATYEAAKEANDTLWVNKFIRYKGMLETIIAANFYRDLIDEIKAVNKFEREDVLAYMPPDMIATFKLIKTQVKYVELKVVGEAIGNVLTKLRAQAHADMVMEADLATMIKGSLSKTVIFFTSKEVGDTIGDKVEAAGFNSISVYGDESKKLTENVKKFTNDKKINPLIASFKTLSTGVPLIAASTAIICELPYRPHILSQAIGRINRIGQPHPTTVIYLILDTDGVPNISTRSREIIQWASESVKEITGVEVESGLKEDKVSSLTQEAIDNTNVIFGL